MSSLTIILKPQILGFRGPVAILTEAFFISFAVAFPVLAHLFGLPIFVILPMHWTVLMAGMIYGWRAGLIAGIASPLLSFLLTGMPLPQLLPLILIEMPLYGFVPGIIREKTSVNNFFALFTGLIAGRIGFVFLAFILGKIDVSLGHFIQNSFITGIPGAFIQLITIPFIVSGFIFLNKKD